MKWNSPLGVVIILLSLTSLSIAVEPPSTGYLTPEQAVRQLKQVAGDNGGIAEYKELATTPGGRSLGILTIGKNMANPAILVVANMEGDSPQSTEAAVKLAQMATSEWSDDLARISYYIIAVGNPDGYTHFFDQVSPESFLNAASINDDNDDATNEDGPLDLNGDGFVTMMRQKHLEGNWIEIEGNPVLMKQAESGKGEVGVYRIFTESRDIDGDGRLGEDGPGGTNPGWNFPHNFKHYTTTNGPWPASEAESRAIMRFAYDHPEIALVLTFGRTNTLKSVPEASQKAQAGDKKFKLPKWIAEETGIDPEQEFELSELVQMARDYTGYQDLTEEMVLQFLGVGAAVNPDRNDIPYWTEITERYKKFMEEAGFDTERLDPRKFSSGCVEEWAYYQYGVPSFSMDFWTLPKPKKEEEGEKKEGMLTPDEIENMSNEEFIELGEERINEFLKASGAPSQYNAQMVIMALQGGMMDTKKMAEMMRKMKSKEEAGGADETEEALYSFAPEMFLEWKPYKHPDLGDVEIGGMIPYADIAPPHAMLDSILTGQLPFVRKLSEHLPAIEIGKTEVEKTGSGVYRVKTWITNTGFLPYPTHQGNRCRRPLPTIVTVSGNGIELLEGKERNTLRVLEGSGGSQKLTWLIAASPGTGIKIETTTPSAGSDSETITLGGN